MFGTAKNLTAKLLAIGLGIAAFGGAANAQVLYMAKDLNYEKAMSALKSGDLETASLHLHKAASFDIGAERLLPVLNNLCAVEYALGRLDSAEAACDRALSEDRHYWRAYVNRGNILKARGNLDGARADYARAVKLSGGADLPVELLARLDSGEERLVANVN